MGFSFRGRTKGKNGWFNYSASSAGLGGSVSTKLTKNITVNYKPSRGFRTTVNLGRGVRWVSSTAKDKTVKPYTYKEPSVATKRRDARLKRSNDEYESEERAARVNIRQPEILAKYARQNEINVRIVTLVKAITTWLTPLNDEQPSENIRKFIAELDKEWYELLLEFDELTDSIQDDYEAELYLKDYTDASLNEECRNFVKTIMQNDAHIDYRVQCGWVESDLEYIRKIRNFTVDKLKNYVEWYSVADESIADEPIARQSKVPVILFIGVVLICATFAFVKLSPFMNAENIATVSRMVPSVNLIKNNPISKVTEPRLAASEVQPIIYDDSSVVVEESPDFPGDAVNSVNNIEEVK